MPATLIPAGATRRGLSAAASAGLTTTFSAFSITNATAADAGAEAVPNGATLSVLGGKVTNIAGGAAAVTWYLSHDSAGKIPYTPQVTHTIGKHAPADTEGGFSDAIGAEYSTPSDGTVGTLYMHAKTDAGTADLLPRLWWRV